MKKIILSVGMILSFVLVQAQMKNETPASDKQLQSTAAAAKQMPDIWDVFQNRRSVRKFLPDSIPQKDILRILNAARMAPTSGNQQPWIFLVIRDRKTIDKMMEACINEASARYDANNSKETKEQFSERVRKTYSAGYFSAPVFIVVLTDNNSKYSDYNHWDGPLAAGYLMLAARALGYGTVFITDAISETVTTKVLQIPERYTRVCITPLGIPSEWPATPEKKNLDEMISFEKIF
jgi:nitroreductase